MLLWIGFSLLAAGCLAFAVDRRAAHFFHDELHQRWAAIVHRTTDWAKGSHWLVIAIAGYVGSWVLAHFWGPIPPLLLLRRTSMAFLVSLAIASIILHSIKVVLGRRRPRDELELNLYGWRPFHFDLQYDSFPSGHSLTIFCVAVILGGALPHLAWLWFVIAVYLAMTRALLNSHYLSDICVGAGIAVLVSREVVILWFPLLERGWF
ncbi:MAG TPA: phosphatase PAP2 family protein [Rhizomicrobium sp.]|nr:phosphatase PAP2 family protein [Rhizomicrobium sp.]